MSSIFRIAVFDRNKENGYFDAISQSLMGHSYFGNNEFEVVDISQLDNESMTSRGPFHAIIYDTEIHGINNSEPLKTFLSTVRLPKKLVMFPFSRDIVTDENVNQETDKINELLPQRDASQKIFPVDLSNPSDLTAFLEGGVISKALEYFELSDEIYQSLPKQKQLYIDNLLQAMEEKDSYTVGHIERVSKYSAAIAKQLGWEETDVQKVESIGFLHDFGKIAIPESNLGNENLTTNAERKQMGIHAEMGASFLNESLFSNDELEGITKHHMPFEYPSPTNPNPHNNPFVNVISVADCLDTMSSQRAYNNPKSIVPIFRDLYSSARRTKEEDGKTVSQLNPQMADAAIVVLAKELSSLGFDVSAMISAVPENWCKETDEGILKILEEHKNEIENVPTLAEGEYCSLGFRLTPTGHLEFEDKKAILNRETRLRNEYQFNVSRYCRDNKFEGETIYELEALVPQELRDSFNEKATSIVERQDELGQKAVEAGKQAKLQQRQANTNIIEAPSISPSQIPDAAKQDPSFNINGAKDMAKQVEHGLSEERENKHDKDDPSYGE